MQIDLHEIVRIVGQSTVMLIMIAGYTKTLIEVCTPPPPPIKDPPKLLHIPQLE